MSRANLSDTRRTLLRMQQRVWRRLRTAVERRTDTRTPELARYQRRYQRDFRGPVEVLRLSHVVDQATEADLVLCGEYHTFRPAQTLCLRLLEAMTTSDRPVCLVVELALTRHQPHLEVFLRGEIDEAELLRRLEYDRTWGFDWAGYRPIFEFARSNAIPIVAMNGPGDATTATLAERDGWAAAVIARTARTRTDSRLLVLVGDLHLAHAHLPLAIDERLRGTGLLPRRLRIFQDNDELYLRLEVGGIQAEAVALGGDAVCVFNGSPWLKLDSYLAWLDRDPDGPAIHRCGWESGDNDAAEHVLELARALSRFLGLTARPTELTVYTPDELTMLARHAGDPVLAELAAFAVAYDTLLLPDGENLVVSRSDLAHLAEAAAELVLHRHWPPTRAELGPGPASFLLRARRRALTYLGSKLVVPTRRPITGETSTALLVSHYVRAIGADLAAGRPPEIVEVAEQDDRRLHHRISVALGRDLGERLHHAFLAGLWDRAQLRQLFSSPPAVGEAESALHQLYAYTATPVTPAAAV